MNILNIVGNDIELGNGIGRLIPEMIHMQNKYSEKIDSSLLLLKKQNLLNLKRNFQNLYHILNSLLKFLSTMI